MIVGVNIQEIGFDKTNKTYGGDHIDEFHIGSIQFQVMKTREVTKCQIPKERVVHYITYENHKVYGGEQPYEMKNAIKFTDDGKFVAENDGSTGSWCIKENDETWLIEMKWDNNGAVAVFELIECLYKIY